MAHFNLCDIVDMAEQCGGNPYWRMSADDRREFSTYAQQKLQARRPPSVKESADDKKDDACLDHAVDAKSEGDTDEHSCDSDGKDVGDDAQNTTSEEKVVSGDTEVITSDDTKASGRAKSQRWVEYCKEARKDLVAEGHTKPDSKVVFARAREYLKADGWL